MIPRAKYYVAHSLVGLNLLVYSRCGERQLILDSSSNNEGLLSNGQSEFKRSDHTQI